MLNKGISLKVTIDCFSSIAELALCCSSQFGYADGSIEIGFIFDVVKMRSLSSSSLSTTAKLLKLGWLSSSIVKISLFVLFGIRTEY